MIATLRPRRPLNWWLAAVMADFWAERQRRDDAREAFSRGYVAEGREFDDGWPPPQLRDYLIAHAYLDLAAATDAAA